MDKAIRKLEKKDESLHKGLKHLEKEDKKRDAVCDLGKEVKKYMKHQKRGR
jgi:hypothetical protein